MRGIVTLAAAFALPENFPYRDLILLTAFAVVLGTLVVQGLTLRPLIAALKFEDDEPGRRRKCRPSPLQWPIARRWRRSRPIRPRQAEILRLEYRALLLRAEDRTRTRHREQRIAGRSAAPPRDRRGTASDAEAAPTEEIGDDAFHQVEEELDRAELSAQA